jgi:PPOX class probable F420-dependent enzyme
MPIGPVPADLHAFLAAPRLAVVASLRDDGSPVTAACWFRFDGSQVLLSVAADGQRLRHVRRDPRVALTVLGEREFTHLSVLGRVVGITLDRDFAGVDEFARHYTGRDYPNHDVPGYVLRVEIERWHLFGDPASDEPPAGPRP